MSGPQPMQGRRPSGMLPQPKPAIRWVGYVLLTLLLAGAGAVYITLGRDSNLAETLPLPPALRTVSPAHEDLMRFGRELNDLTIEAESRFPEPPGAPQSIAPAMLAHIERLHEVGRELEPRVSRQERRALTAFQQAEGLLRAFVSGEGYPPYDRQLIGQVQQQITYGLALGRGRAVKQLLLGSKPAPVLEPKKSGSKKSTLPFNPLNIPKDALKLPLDGE